MSKTVAGVKITATRKDAFRLFRDGSRTLARMEANGNKIDLEYIDRAKREMKAKADKLSADLYTKHKDVMRAWKRVAGTNFKVSSKEQLGKVFFQEMKYKPTDFTPTGKPKATEDTLSKIDHPFIADYFAIEKSKKAITTLIGIEREVDDNGYLHPMYNLHIPITYRSSSSMPNSQNWQVRLEEMAKFIRQAFVSRFGKKGRLIENDFKTLEVGISACYHKDPRMLKNLRNNHDYHADVAGRIYFCDSTTAAASWKKIRYGAKNKFVFPEFYGSYYIDCARNLWDWMRSGKLMVGDITMQEHLAKKGITKLGKCDPERPPKKGTFEMHVKQVEDHFWNVEYPVYTKWKKDWYRAYLASGEVPMFTGFTVKAALGRNDVINYPVQGAAFHCLLWTANRLQRELTRRGMRAVLVNQIHDCLVADVPEDETQEYLNLVHHIVSVELPKAWKWIIVPMEVEAEVCPLGGTWYEKKPWERNKSGLWDLAA